MLSSRPSALRIDLVLRGFLVALFALAGAMKITAHPFEIQAFNHFGYPAWFMYAIGVTEFVAAFALLHARFLPKALAFLGIVLIGAVWSHIKAGDPLAATLPAAIALLMLAWLVAIHCRRQETSSGA